MEGKTNFSRRLEQFDGLTWPWPPHILPHMYATDDDDDDDDELWLIEDLWLWRSDVIQLFTAGVCVYVYVYVRM